MSSLYTWQKNCLKQWEKHNCRGIVHAVTGSGKTRLAIAAIDLFRRQHPNCRVKIVVPTIPLASQWLRALEDHASCEEERPSLIGGGQRDRDARKVKVYVINSARQLLSADIRRDLAQDRHVLLICDECHHYHSPENRRIFRFLDTSSSQSDSDSTSSKHDISPDLFAAPSAYEQIPVDRSDALDFSAAQSVHASIPAERYAALGLSAAQSVHASISAEHYAALGLSATPDDGTGEDFPCHALGDVIYHYDAQKAAKENVIAPYFIANVSVSFFPEEKKEYNAISDRIRGALAKLFQDYKYLSLLSGNKQAFLKEVTRLAEKADMDPSHPAAAFLLLTYQRKQLCVMADARYRCCIDLIATLHPDDRIIVFSERIEQAEETGRQLRLKYGSCVSVYHSRLTAQARARVMEDFRHGQSRILVTCKCLDEGIDVPDANIAIVLSGSSVPRQRIQRLGRVLRRSRQKDAACLYYLFIRQASEDNIYLRSESDPDHTFDLRYELEDGAFEDTSEGAFGNELYTYIARDILAHYSAKEASPAYLAELRKCLVEGLTRPDYLLPPDTIRRKQQEVPAQHEKNYWFTIQMISRQIQSGIPHAPRGQKGL